MTDPTTELRPSVRRANPSDAPAIAALVNRVNRTDASREPEAPGASEATIQKLQDQGFFLVLDRKRGGLAAAIYIEMRRLRGRVDLLAVAPECTGLGLDRRLVAVAEAVCEAEGCTAMELCVARARSDLRPWYRSLGYRECGAALAGDGEPENCRINMTKALA